MIVKNVIYCSIQTQRASMGCQVLVGTEIVSLPKNNFSCCEFYGREEFLRGRKCFEYSVNIYPCLKLQITGAIPKPMLVLESNKLISLVYTWNKWTILKQFFCWMPVSIYFWIFLTVCSHCKSKKNKQKWLLQCKPSNFLGTLHIVHSYTNWIFDMGGRSFKTQSVGCKYLICNKHTCTIIAALSHSVQW